jgi:hypothetical protein
MTALHAISGLSFHHGIYLEKVSALEQPPNLLVGQ